jgi:hypothetical protein
LAIEIASSKPSKVGNDGPEDLLLEDAHLVVAFEDRRRDVVAAREIARERDALATREELRAFFFSNIDIRQDLLELIVRSLGAELGIRIERVSRLGLLRALHGGIDELAVDRLLDQRA